jgi:hypothetical protein
VANLDSELLGALRQAATDAADDGVEFYVNSGRRSLADPCVVGAYTCGAANKRLDKGGTNCGVMS